MFMLQSSLNDWEVVFLKSLQMPFHISCEWFLKSSFF